MEPCITVTQGMAAATADSVNDSSSQDCHWVRRPVTWSARMGSHPASRRRLWPLHRGMGLRARCHSHAARRVPARASEAAVLAMAVAAHVELTRANAGVTPLPPQGRVLLRP